MSRGWKFVPCRVSRRMACLPSSLSQRRTPGFVMTSDEFLRDRCQEVPFLPDAHYYFIGATLSAGPLGSTLGDLLVRSPSASGRGNGKGRSIPFEVDNGHELTGVNHFDLLNHPAVYEQLRGWITRRPTRRAPLELTA